MTNILVSPGSKPVVSFQNVNHYFDTGAVRTQVLFGLTAEIWPGELVMVMGPSGSGKTTMLNLVGALRRVLEGSLRVLGENLQSAPESALQRLRARIGFVFQQHHLLHSLTARQNVQMGVSSAGSAREARRRAELILGEVGLAGREDAYPKQLSVGQRQRVAVARALVREPELLLADEPTASLDGQTGREIMELLRRLARRQGCAVVIVTHDARILDAADRLMYLEDGRLSSFASVTSPHAVHLLTALRSLAHDARIGDLLSRMSEAEFLDMMRTLAAESEQFLNVLDLSSSSEPLHVIREAARAVLQRACSRLGARAALVWTRSGERPHCLLGVPECGDEASAPVLEAMRRGVAGAADGSLCVPLLNREYEIFAVTEICGESLGDEAERAFRDFARPLGIVAQLYARLESRG